ncbi:MAG TPA: PIN domain-containing protein [Burkholderiales bacterium]|nr:PIN domain-containing protein [Burkholderiales bacterium]
MIALDSSVIVAALVSWHERHAQAARAVERALGAKDGVVIPLHALVESLAVLTRLPAPHRLAPADALTLLRENFASTPLAGLHARSAWQVLNRVVANGLGGGITHDAVILESAEDAGATELLTLNERDYERLDPRLSFRTP